MAFHSHGELNIWVDHNIVYMELSGNWNLEKAKDFIHELNYTITPQVSPPFVAVAMLDNDWMPTADAIPYLFEATNRAINMGLVREAYVSSSPISSRVTKRFVVPEDSERYQSREFVDLDDAVQWLKEGLSGSAAVKQKCD
ncbi:hypothetical protein [Aestuariibacter salexigens]|uniref:hypothetical protein n=1 Tax=Aestuariibacter salexigens TaxID=226010 RepID=UPI000425EFB8|nr:hypothetical protein [Aestuariibacter salexigens]